jgi:RNA polymerase sigma factor (sigma-70 family)
MGRIAESRPLREPAPSSGPHVGVDRNGRSASEADAAARALYERYANRIFRYCLPRLRSVEEAEDAVQTAFLYAYVGLKRGVRPEFEVAWLYKIAENVCRTRLRSHLRRGRFEINADLAGLLEPAAQTESVHDEKIEALPEILAGMPASQRRALLLREVQGLSYREIADQLQTSVSAVETLLFRARRSCARELERLGRPAEKALSLGTVLGTVKSFVSRYLAASGGAKAAAVAAAAAVTGAAIAVTPQVVSGSAGKSPAASSPARTSELAASGPAERAASARGTRTPAVAKAGHRRKVAPAKTSAAPAGGSAPETVVPPSPSRAPADPAPTPASATPQPAASLPLPAMTPPSLPPLPVELPPAPTLPELPPTSQLPPTPQLPPPPSVAVPSLP